MFPELDLFPCSGEGWEAPTLLGQLERLNVTHWTRYLKTQKNTTFRKIDLFLPSFWGCETSTVLGVLERANSITGLYDGRSPKNQ
jgi:hypothetical protein